MILKFYLASINVPEISILPPREGRLDSFGVDVCAVYVLPIFHSMKLDMIDPML